MFRRSFIALIWAVGALATASGCTTVHRTPLEQRKVGPPLFEMKKGGGSFPLANGEIKSPDELKASLAQGYADRMSLPDGAAGITILGANLGHLDSLKVDISGATVNRSYQPAQFDSEAKVTAVIPVERLQYRAAPIIFDNAKVTLDLVAEGATLQAMTDHKGRSGLVIAGARHGRLDVSIEPEDMQQAFLQSVRRGASRAGVSVKAVEIKMKSDGPRSLEFEAHVWARWVLLPMTFRVYGRVDIDGRMRAILTNVGVEGEDMGGKIAAGFIDPKIAKAEAKISPLIGFIDPRTHATDIGIDLTHGLKAFIEFGH